LYHFKNLFRDNFSGKESTGISNLFNQLENNISLNYKNTYPSCTIKHDNYFKNILFFILNIFIGTSLFNELKTKSQVHFLILIIVLNCLFLSIVGFYQKINHQWTEDYVEILGLWDAPEPRYYFSTFTYKNHWSAYAVMCVYCLFYLINANITEARKMNQNIFKSKYLFFLIMSTIIISFSVLYSGSRSGSLIILLSIVFYLLKSIRDGIFIKYIKMKYLGLLFIPLISLLMFAFFKDQKWVEMQKNTSSQWKNISEGKFPLRLHFWNDSIEVIRSQPFWGYGYNSFASIYPKFQCTEVRTERNLGLENAHKAYVPLVAHAHNDVLEFVIEWGLIGFFCIFLPLLFLLFRYIKNSNCKLSALLLYGCLAFIIYCFIDFPTRTPACLLTFCVLCGITVKLSRLKRYKYI
jgi:O-antigen ligase